MRPWGPRPGPARRRRYAGRAMWGLAGAAGLLVLAWLLSPLLLRAAAGGEGSPVFGFPGADAAVALTLDDGPHPGATDSLLRVLERHGARATFFLIGSRAERHPGLVEAIDDAGHEVAHHMWRDRLTVRLDSAALEAGLRRTRAALAPRGSAPWLRPGGGRWDDRVVRAARRHGYRLALGTVYPVDTVVRWAWPLARFVAAWARAGDVIVLHGGPGRGARTAAVLDRVLPELRARGLEVVTLSELAARAGAIGVPPPGS